MTLIQPVAAHLVEFEGLGDPMHPYNWKSTTKLFTSLLVCSGSFIVALTSAILAPALTNATHELNNPPTEVAKLGTALYILGFSFGPLLWAPTSELHGRKWPLTIAMLLGGLFTLGSALARNIETLIVCRFLAGVCGASQFTVVPGVLADVYDNTYRGMAIQLYSLTVFGGPACAPFVGGFIVANDALGWRWTLYVPAILSLVNGAVSVLALKETYAPCILVAKAVSIRKRTEHAQQVEIYAEHERLEVDITQLIEKYLTRPVKMLITEPILLLVSLYMAFIYGMVYCLLDAYSYVFEKVYGMPIGLSGLPFLGPLTGEVLAVALILSRHASYVEKLGQNDNVPLPEWRLTPTLHGGPIFTIGIFWFGWTGWNYEIHWAIPSVAGLFIGLGAVSVFLPCFNYIVDAYLPLAASAVAANVILRSVVAAGFPLFSRQMFQDMGVQWACTLLGCFSAVMIPIPIAFRVYGQRLSRKSKSFQ